MSNTKNNQKQSRKMKPAPAILKRRKVAKNREVKQNRGGARRKRTSPKSTSKSAPAKESPSQWSSSKDIEGEEVASRNPAVQATTAAQMYNDSNNTETYLEEKNEDESVGEVSDQQNTLTSTTIDPSPTGNRTEKLLFEPN
jgi:hypothetical protein